MSSYPSRTDLINAMKNPQVSFNGTELIGGKVVTGKLGPLVYAGGYALVFPFINKDKKKVAVRCWFADIGNQKKKSQEISTYLDNLKSEYFANFKYVEDALLTNNSYQSIVIMDWIEGKTLKKYVNEVINDKVKILGLAERFKEMIAFFHKKNIAHGDLQHGNIMVKSDGHLVIIDYDSMYIETLKNMPDTIQGLPGYQHPARKHNKFTNSKMDYFSELVVYLSLLIFADDPSLWPVYYETEDLLFSSEDFVSPNTSSLIKKMSNSNNKKIKDLTMKLREELNKNDLSKLLPLDELLINKWDETINEFKIKIEKPISPSKKREIDYPDLKETSSKFEQQPNPPKKKETTFPGLNETIKKFTKK